MKVYNIIVQKKKFFHRFLVLQYIFLTNQPIIYEISSIAYKKYVYISFSLSWC